MANIKILLCTTISILLICLVGLNSYIESKYSEVGILVESKQKKEMEYRSVGGHIVSDKVEDIGHYKNLMIQNINKRDIEEMLLVLENWTNLVRHIYLINSSISRTAWSSPT